MSVQIKYRIGKSTFFQALTVVLACSIVIPLIAILVYIIKAGITKINWHFLTNLPKPVGEVGGGIANALLGSIIIIAVASLIAIPFGILCGIYLSENKKSN
jgi:phosphate transport system permease protein